MPPLPKLNPDLEKEIKPDIENQERLSVSEIMEKIENGKEVGEEEEKKLRTAIEEVVLTEKREEEWTAEEEKMLSVYSRGVNEGLFPESEKISVTLSFDLESIKYNRSRKEEKRETVKKRVEDAESGLAGEGIIMSEYLEDLEKREEKRIELKEEMERINDEKIDIYRKFYEEEINTEDILSEKGREDLMEIINALKESNQVLLNLKRFEYYSFATDDFESLIEKSHLENDFEIRRLEELLGSYDRVINLLSKKEEELTPEEKNKLDRLRQWIKENPKTTLAVVIAFLVVLGLATYGIPAAGMPGMPGMPGVGGVFAVLKTARGVMGGAGILGAALYKLSQIKEEDVDDFMSKICGVAIPHRKKTTTATK